MRCLLGLDLGTSSVKCLLVCADGQVLGAAEREYPILLPQEGYAEQDPETWWQMSVAAIREVLAASGVDPSTIQGIGFSGQMHGGAFLADDGSVLRPAIIWPDQRSQAQCRQVYRRIGPVRLGQIAGSGVFPGFMLASLLWLQQNEPQTWQRLGHIVFPKDYVRLRLIGELATDATDGSGGLLLDIRQRDWSDEIIGQFDIPAGILPPVRGSQEVIGAVTPEAAQATGLTAGTPVVTGAVDQATGALGNGITGPGMVSATIGTGGQMVAFLAQARIDKQLRVHTFCHALPDTWYLLGATLAAGLAFRWLRDAILNEPGPGAYHRMTAQASEALPGSEGLLFLPYLVGERAVGQTASPSGVFFGLTPRHNRSHMIRAVMEGITLALRRPLDIFREMSVVPECLVGCGGGARSPLWRQMMADIFQTPVVQTAASEQSAMGAAILAGLGTGVFGNAAEACNALVRYGPVVEPQPAAVATYQAAYERFCSVYEHLQPDFARSESF